MALRNRKVGGVAERVNSVLSKAKFWSSEQQYPVRVWVLKSNGDIDFDYAARYTYDEYEAYELKSDGTEFKAPDYKHLRRKPDGELLLILGSPEKGVYEPLRVDWESFQFQPGDNSWLEWQVQSMRRRHEEWKEDSGGWLTHPAAPIVATGIFIFLTMVGFTYYWQNGLTQIQGMTDALIQSGRSAAEAAKNVG